MTGITTLSRLYIFTPLAISRARRCSCIKSVRVREDINPNHVINRAARVARAETKFLQNPIWLCQGAAIILARDAMKGFVENQCFVATILADVVVQKSQWKARRLRFKLSTDPKFFHKLHDILGLHLNPPSQPLVLSVDIASFKRSPIAVAFPPAIRLWFQGTQTRRRKTGAPS